MSDGGNSTIYLLNLLTHLGIRSSAHECMVIAPGDYINNFMERMGWESYER
jgi:hypothetical protein